MKQKLKNGEKIVEYKQKKKENEGNEETKTQLTKEEKEKQKLMNTTGWEAINSRKDKPKIESYGYSNELMYKAYENQLKDLDKVQKFSKRIEDYNDAKKRLGDDLYGDVNDLSYGESVKPSEAKLNILVKTMDKLDDRRKKFSKRRRYYEEKDVDSINKKNEDFNKKIEKTYGKYSSDIKDNLERGTAL